MLEWNGRESPVRGTLGIPVNEDSRARNEGHHRPRRSRHGPCPARPVGAAEILPEGFAYAADIISSAEQDALLEAFRDLDFREFEFQGYRGKRRVVSFGLHYDFAHGELRSADEMPAYLLPLREKAARFAGLKPEQLPHALVTEYSVGAPIGWHKDRPVFDDVIGISLLSPCRFRFRRKAGKGWERAAVILSRARSI